MSVQPTRFTMADGTTLEGQVMDPVDRSSPRALCILAHVR